MMMNERELLHKHDREIAVHKQRLDSHDEVLKALTDKLDSFQSTFLNSTVAIVCAIIGSGVLTALLG